MNTVEELIATIQACDDVTGIAPLLGDNLSLVLAAFSDVWRSLNAATPTPAVRVALRWLYAYVLTDGAFWIKDRASPHLTPFGRAVLADASGARPHGEQSRDATGRVQPSEQELLRLDAVLWQCVRPDIVAADAQVILAVIAAALSLSSQEHANVRDELESAGSTILDTLHTRYETSRDPADLDAAIRCYEQARELFDSAAEYAAGYRMNYANIVLSRYQARGQSTDLDTAIRGYVHALTVCAPATLKSAQCWNNLSLALRIRYKVRRDPADLDAVIHGFARALDIYDVTTPEGAGCCLNHALSLIDRYEARGAAADLDMAIAGFDRAMGVFRPMTLEGARCRNNYALALRARYRARGNRADLDSAVLRYEEALAVYDPTMPEGAGCRVNYANALQSRFEARGDPADLEAAIRNYERALETLAPIPLESGRSRMSLGGALFARYEMYGAPTDLDAAISSLTQALAAYPPGTWESAVYRTNHANALLARYDERHIPADLDAAITGLAQAWRVFDPATSGRAICQMNLAGALLRRHRVRGNAEDLDTAILGYEDALRMVDPASMDGAASLMNLANAMIARYRTHGDLNDLDVAIAGYQQMLSIIAPVTVQGILCQVNLATALSHRFEIRGESIDLDAAIAVSTEASAVAKRLDATPLQQKALLVLAQCYRTENRWLSAYVTLRQAAALLESRFLTLSSQEYQRSLLANEENTYTLIVDTCLQIAEVRPRSASRWRATAWRYAERGRARFTLQAIRAVASDGPRGAPQSERAQVLRELSALDRELAALFIAAERITAPLAPDMDRHTVTEEAHEAIKSERAARIAITERRRADCLDRLAAIDPALAAMQRVTPPDRAAIERGLRALPDGAVILEFAALPDGDFALFRLDGQAIETARCTLPPGELHRRTRVRLELLARYRAEADSGVRALLWRDFARALDEDLRWLGGYLAPVLVDLLGPHLPAAPPDGRAPHLLIVPAGDLHALPLHALPLGGGDCLLDRVAVSYLPAATALADLGAQAVRPGPYHGFAPPVVPSLPLALPQVRVEAARLGGVVFPGARATMAAVRQSVGGIFACATHGRANPANPAAAVLQLAGPGGQLRDVTAFEFLVGLDQLQAGLLLLWACETHGEGPQSGEEYVGLTRSFLRAGRTLVALLWSIRDDAALLVSSRFCGALNAGLTVAQALRAALREVRTADYGSLCRWGVEIAAALPAAERAAFAREWIPFHEFAAIEAGGEVIPAHFGQIASWAPFVCIGWPGALPM